MSERHEGTGGGRDRSGYDAVRGELIARGYLDGRVERFVLAEPLHGRSSLGRLTRSAARAALIGGPLLGALLAAAAAVANRPLVGAADLLLLWLYFATFAALALFALDLAAAALIGGLVRRRGARLGDTWRASFLVGLPTLGYLVLVWAAHRPGAGPLEDAVFLVAAVGMTLLVAWLAGLVSLADLIGRTGTVPDRVRRPVVVLLLAGAAVGAGLVATRVAVDSEAAAPSPFLPVAVPGRAWVVGIDGLDVTAVERGAMLSALAGRGARWPLLRPPGTEPAEVWTTLLTGMRASAHGVRGAGVERLPGVATPLAGPRGPVPLRAALGFLLPTRTAPATGVGRRVRNVPEVLGLLEPSAAVGWWASWPALDPEAGGYVVSDRVLPKLLSGAAPDRDTAPPALFTRLAADFEADRVALRHEFETVFPDSEAGPYGRVLWESFIIDAWSWRIGRRLLEDERVRTVFVYLPGLDILRARLGSTSSTAVVDAYVGWLDRRVGEALAFPAESLIVVGDPGREAPGIAAGFLMASGPGIDPGCLGAEIDPLQVAPLLLALRGFPASDEMPGRLPSGCGMAPDRVPERIDSFGRRPALADDAVSEYDAEMVERLRSLGYLN